MSKTELLKQLEAKRTRCQIWTRVMGYLRTVSYTHLTLPTIA